ncbi:MAG: InlB B-repeat-containing protein [Acholeplasmatales bacterium]|nr:InlB B-repeat-containing protein [Acholeplasmatales bacterium]
MKKGKIIGLFALGMAISLASCNITSENQSNSSTNITESSSANNSSTTTSQTSANNQIEVTFESNGGSNVLKQNVVSGNKVLKPTDPEKTPTNTIVYTFAGWYKDNTLNQEFDFNTSITRSMTLYAKWVESEREYTIKFVNYDDSEISTQKYHYNDTVTAPSDPEKPAGDEVYYFSGWDSEVTAVTSDKIYKATYSSKPRATITNLSDISKVYDGTDVETPTYDINSEADVKIEYKRVEEDDTKFSEEKPVYIGKYTLRLTASETNDYAGKIIEKDFEISYESHMVLNLSFGANIELLLDKCGYVVTETALDDPALFILSHESYIGLSSIDAAKKLIDDLVEYQFIKLENNPSLNFEYSFSGDATRVKNEITNYIKSKYNIQNDNQISVYPSSFNLSKFKSDFRNYIYYYTYSEVDGFSIDRLVSELIEMRNQTKDLKSMESKRLYALYLAEKIAKLKVDSINDSIKDDQTQYSSIGSYLAGMYNSCTGAFDNALESFYTNYVVPTTSIDNARNSFAMSYLGLYDALNNNPIAIPIHRFIAFTINTNYKSASAGLFSAFSSVVLGFDSFKNSYNSYSTQIASLCEENNLDLDAIVANNLAEFKEAAMALAKSRDYDLFNRIITVNGEKLYYYQNEALNETYYITKVDAYNRYCFIYDGLISESELQNKTPIRYASCYMSGSKLVIQDYYRQDNISLTIGDDSITFENILDSDILYIANNDNYGNGTYVFVTENGVNNVYTYLGIHTQEEIESGTIQYVDYICTWESLNDHIIYRSSGDVVTNYVVDSGTLLKEYEIDLKDAELKYVANGIETGSVVNYAFVEVDGIKYALKVVYFDAEQDKYISLTFDQVLEILLDYDKDSEIYGVFGFNGDHFWKEENDIITLKINAIDAPKAYTKGSNNILVDVTNNAKVTEVKHIFNDSANYYGLVYYENYFGDKRYEVRVYDSEATSASILEDINTNGFASNKYSWFETETDVVVIMKKNTYEGYSESKIGEVKYLLTKTLTGLTDFSATASDVVDSYTYYDSGLDKTFHLQVVKGIRLAQVYTGEVDFNSEVLPMATTMVTWGYEYSRIFGDDMIHIGLIYDDSDLSDFYINDSGELTRVEIFYM